MATYLVMLLFSPVKLPQMRYVDAFAITLDRDAEMQKTSSELSLMHPCALASLRLSRWHCVGGRGVL